MDGTMYHRGKGRRLMLLVHSLIWELSNVEVTRELEGSGESESIHRDEREQTAGSKYVDLGTKDATENSTGARKNDWLPWLPDKRLRRYIVLPPVFRVDFSGGMHQ